MIIEEKTPRTLVLLNSELRHLLITLEDRVQDLFNVVWEECVCARYTW